jgi:PAS domain S-box-containing protein
MIRHPIKILLVEDNVDQLLLAERALKRFAGETEVVSVKNGQDCLDRLSREDFSVVILDYSLPRINGMEVLERITAAGFDVPVIMVTGQGDERVAVEAMKNGAYDYIVKTQGYLSTLPHSVETTIQRHDLQTRLKASEDKYKRLAENANDLIFTTDRFGHFAFLTEKVEDLLGYSPEELMGTSFKELLAPTSLKAAESLFPGEFKGEFSQLVELEFITKRGESKSLELNLSTVTQSGRIVGLEAIGRDITHRKLLEKEVLQRNRELTTLLSVSSAIAHSLNIEEIATAALKKICEFTGLDCGAIYTLGLSDSSPQVSGSYGLTDHSVDSLRECNSWGETLDYLANFRTPIVTRSLQTDGDCGLPSALVRTFLRERIQSLIILPLFFKEKLLGFALVGSLSQNDFTPQEIEILNSVCNQTGSAIANARLFGAIKEAKTEWETTFDAMPELVYMQDLGGQILRVNRAMARRLKIEPQEIVGKTVEDVFQDARSPWCYHQKPELYEVNKTVSVEFEDRLLNGTFEIATTPIYSSEGQLFAWLFVGKDITEQRQLQNQFVQIERLKALGEMASGVAHDFNNVLAGILGKTQLMLATLEKGIVPDRESLRQNLKTIEKTTKQGSETVKRIQDFTRIRTDQKFDHVDVNDIVNYAIDVIRPVWKDQCEAKGIRIEIQFRPGATPPVNGIGDELTEVMVNVLRNAIDAMPTGGTLSIKTALGQAGNGDSVEIEVSDTGVGMSSEVKRRIFDPFFSTKGPKGTGLGMSVAYGIISRHQGSIRFETELGKGTTCWLSLPLAKQSAKIMRLRTPAMEKEKLKILVIDDEDVIRGFLAEMFSSAGYEVDAAAAGPGGIALFEKNHYDLVFSDLGLPEMSGWDVAKAIRARNPSVPIVLLSGWGIQLDDVRIQECGIDLVLSKPCQMEELLSAVEDVLSRRQANGETS